MRIRPIHADEREVFAGYSENADLNSYLAQYLANCWGEHTSRPEWCFIAEDGERVIGRVMYWALPTCELPRFVEFLDVPWTGSYREVGVALLRDTLTRFQMQGAETMRYALDLPSQFGAFPDKRVEVLERVGFLLRREGDRWEWTAPGAPLPSLGRMVFRTWPEVGEGAFVEALGRTLEGTLDRALQHDRQQLGPEQAARAYVNVSQAFQQHPTWWQLAYTPDGALVGVIMVGANDGGPIIDYLGIIPEQRGHGYGNDLLAHGIAVLQAAGATRIRSDSDTRNLPMAAAFRRAGFRKFRTRMVYSIDLLTGDTRR